MGHPDARGQLVVQASRWRSWRAPCRGAACSATHRSRLIKALLAEPGPAEPAPACRGGEVFCCQARRQSRPQSNLGGVPGCARCRACGG